MTSPDQESEQQVNDLFDSTDFAKAVETEEFKVFLDHLPIAIVISKLLGNGQRIVFANKAYTELTGQFSADVIGRGWSTLNTFRGEDDPKNTMGHALLNGDDYLGTFQLSAPKELL